MLTLSRQGQRIVDMHEDTPGPKGVVPVVLQIGHTQNNLAARIEPLAPGDDLQRMLEKPHLYDERDIAHAVQMRLEWRLTRAMLRHGCDRHEAWLIVTEQTEWNCPSCGHTNLTPDHLFGTDLTPPCASCGA